MLTKLLVTLVVAIIGWKLISKRNSVSQNIKNETICTSPYTGKAAIVAVVLIVVAASIVGWQWWTGFQQMHVTIVSPLNGNVETYTVRKRDIGEDKIVTVDGLVIRLSKEERIEIAP